MDCFFFLITGLFDFILLRVKSNSFSLFGRSNTGMGGRQNSLPLTTNFSQNVMEPSKGISYPVGDLHFHFTKLTGLVAYISQTGQQCFPACFCHPTVGNFDVSSILCYDQTCLVS